MHVAPFLLRTWLAQHDEGQIDSLVCRLHMLVELLVVAGLIWYVHVVLAPAVGLLAYRLCLRCDCARCVLGPENALRAETARQNSCRTYLAKNASCSLWCMTPCYFY
jgi:hypothetical protein